MMPTMLPRVGAGKQPGVFYNTGHGHLGWTLSAATAEMVTDRGSHTVPTAQCVHSALSMPLTAAVHCVCAAQVADAATLTREEGYRGQVFSFAVNADIWSGHVAQPAQ